MVSRLDIKINLIWSCKTVHISTLAEVLTNGFYLVFSIDREMGTNIKFKWKLNEPQIYIQCYYFFSI